MALPHEVTQAVQRIERLLGPDPELCKLQAMYVLGGIFYYGVVTARAIGLDLNAQLALLKAANADADSAIAALTSRDLLELLRRAHQHWRALCRGTVLKKREPEVSGEAYARQGRVDADQVAKVDAEADRIIAAVSAALESKPKPEPDKEG